MILTGKAKEDFEKWLEEGNHTPWVAFFYNLPDTVMYAYYQEWFDSVGYYIGTDIMPYSGKFCTRVFSKEYISEGFIGNTRTKALSAAILTCNDLYNER